MNQKDLRIAIWNANGVLNKRQELEIFLSTQHIDVCLISETHLTNQSYLKIKGYTVYHTTHPATKQEAVVQLSLRNTLTTTKNATYKGQKFNSQ